MLTKQAEIDTVWLSAWAMVKTQVSIKTEEEK